MGKRKCKFNSDLQQEFPFLKRGKLDGVVCSVCNTNFSIAQGGRRDITHHISTEKHKKHSKAAAISKVVSTFFKKKEPSRDDLQCASKEITFAYHNVLHDFSFKSSDCSSKLINHLYDPKYCSARTKTEGIIVKVISPLFFEELIQEIKLLHFVSVIIDSSNRLHVKLVPVMIRYFNPVEGIKVKLIEFGEVPGETSDILTEYLYNVLEKHNLSDKVVCFSADNTNTNFGGAKRQGKINVFTKLQHKIGHKLLGIGCAAHIVHNCIQTAADNLPVDIEVIVVKIYKFFYIYTVRVTTLKEFCEFSNIEYKKVLSHSSTRFLSLLPGIERILRIFNGLKSYFLSQDKCPIILKSFFENPANELYMWFLHGTLELFNKTILKMEKTECSATEVNIVYLDLIKKIEERKNNQFLPQTTKQLLLKLRESGEINENEFMQKVESFYEDCLRYLYLWEDSFGNASKFKWIMLREKLAWAEIEVHSELINQSIHKNHQINIDELFDEINIFNHVFENSIFSEGQTFAQKWSELFKILKATNNNCENLMKLTQYVLSLPGTSASVERVFSIMNNIWKAERGCMHTSTVKALLNIKVNSNLDCIEFYNRIKTESEILKKVISSEKYEWCKKKDEQQPNEPQPSTSKE